MNRTLRITRISALILFVCSSCDPSMVYEESKNLKGASWNKDQAMEYQVNITDTVGLNTVYLVTRNLGSYKNSNLFLFINTTAPTGAQMRDTLEVTLANPDGRWKGKGIGDLYYLRTAWRTNVRFPFPGVYTFSIVHGMREDELKGIEDVGIRIEKVKQ